MKEITIEAGHGGRRIDQVLAELLAPELSRSRIQALIRGGSVGLDGTPVTEPKARLPETGLISISLPEPEEPVPAGEDIPLVVLYEDDELIVIDKPAGLVVHPGAGVPNGTLVNALIYHYGPSLSGIGGVKRPGIVHRLDKDTSGVMVVAKSDRAHRGLAEAFAAHGRDGDLQRSYLALVWGAPDRMKGVIDAPLGRANSDRTRRAVVPEGRSDARHAITRFAVERRFDRPEMTESAASLVQCWLETGRTHQIRVHMAHIGHPLIGDRTYGQAFATKANRLDETLAAAVRGFPRQALHATRLAFRHPVSGERLSFATEPPADMASLIASFTQAPSA